MKQYQYLAYAIIALYLAPFSNLMASEGEEHDHYERVKPKTVEAAIIQLEDSLTAVQAALRNSDLHKIHELSYSLEGSVEALQDYADSLQDTLDVLEERIEIIHHASEDDELTKVQANFPAALRLSKKAKKLLDQ